MSTTEGGSCCPPGSHGAPPRFDNEPLGTYIQVAGASEVPCYYVEPATSGSVKAMILFPDVWGFQSRIVKIADWLSQELSCHVLICDFFRGETKDNHPDMQAWFATVPYEPNIAQDVTACVEYLKTEKNISAFGAMGFCWGGWAIAKTCQAGLVPWQAIVSPHPSLVVEKWIFGGDDIALMHSIPCPALFMPAGNDPAHLKPSSAEFQGMPNKESKSIPFEDMAHGWTTRGDIAEPAIQRDVEAALQETRKFLQAHL